MKKKELFFRKHRIDTIIFLLSIIIAIILSEKPKAIDINYYDVNTITSKKNDMNNIETETSENEDEYKDIKERNIFAQDGKYIITPPPNILQQIPEKPYNLIAVLKGIEKRALFRDYKGTMLFVKEGDKMIDDAIIEKIDNTSVKVRKEDDLLEFKIFDVVPKKDISKQNK